MMNAVRQKMSADPARAAGRGVKTPPMENVLHQGPDGNPRYKHGGHQSPALFIDDAGRGRKNHDHW